MAKKSDDLIKFTDNRMGLKYAILYDEHASRLTGSSRKFDARIDDTDHVAFYCEKCEREVRVVKMILYKESSDKHKLKLIYTLWLELFCETCGASDKKKMYMNSPVPGNINWH